MIFLVPAALLFGLMVIISTVRYRQELRRQRTLTWPRAAATLSDGPDTLLPRKRRGLQQLRYYHAELTEPYVFYAHGRRYTGRRIAPGIDDLEHSVALDFLENLEGRRRYYVYFNPDDPDESYLTVGGEIFGLGQVLFYSLSGMGVPYLLFAYRWLLGQGNRVGALYVLVVLFLPLFINVFYQRSKSPPDLTAALKPVEAAPGAELLPPALRRKKQKSEMRR